MLKGNSYYSKESNIKDNLDDNLDFYDFIEDIMEDKLLPVEERELFWKEFGKKYSCDVNFRYKNHGKYILFHRNKYIGVFNSVEEARILYPEKGRKLSYIGDDKIDGHAYKVVNHQNEGDDRGCYKLKMNIMFNCGHKHSENYTFDTGCTDTFCFMPINWDIENEMFVKVVGDKIPYDVFGELNDKNSELLKITMGGVGSKNKYNRMQLDPPLSVNLENNSNVNLEFILVPRKECQKFEERLLGTDFMHERYTFKFGMFNDVYGLRVSDLEYEYY